MLALEKVLSSFLTLPGLFWSVWLIITIYLFRKARSVTIYFLSLISLILMYVIFTALGTSFLVVPLENMYSDSYTEYNDNQYPIIVMGGGINYGSDKAYLSPYSLQRVVKGYEIYRKIATPIVYTGGVAIGQKEIGESEIAAEWLGNMGVEKEDIVIENKARTTYENGVYVKEWLLDYYANGQNKQNEQEDSLSGGEAGIKVYLVTNALHLPRSVMVFEKQGIDVIPVSSGIITDHRHSWLAYLPNRGSLTANMMALHEWMGLVWYKITRRI